MKKLPSLAAGLFVLVALGAWAARTYGFYSAYWYTDVILHITAGAALGFFWLGLNRGAEKRGYIILLGAVAFAVLGSVAWELWEFAGWRITTPGMRYYIPELGDTLEDLSYGALGGFLAALAGRNIKKHGPQHS